MFTRLFYYYSLCNIGETISSNIKRKGRGDGNENWFETSFPFHGHSFFSGL
jgi:hypothetical protein